MPRPEMNNATHHVNRTAARPCESHPRLHRPTLLPSVSKPDRSLVLCLYSLSLSSSSSSRAAHFPPSFPVLSPFPLGFPRPISSSSFPLISPLILSSPNFSLLSPPPSILASSHSRYDSLLSPSIVVATTFLPGRKKPAPLPSSFFHPDCPSTIISPTAPRFRAFGHDVG